MGEALGRAKASGLGVMTVKKTLPDGTQITATKRGEITGVSIQTGRGKEGAQQGIIESVKAYISSTGGLRIFDLIQKKLVKTLTGLEDYEVNDVSINGRIVHMSGDGIAVRVDLANDSAFGYNYPADGIELDNDIVPAFAEIHGSRLSPDDTRLVHAFDRTYTPIVIDGLGGFIVADAETLAPLRNPIRMSFRPQCALWAPDSQRFYLSTSLDTDSDGVPLVEVSESMSDYVSSFTRDGVLIASREVATHPFPPNTGIARRIRSMAIHPNGTRLYVHVRKVDNTYAVHALDLTDDAMPIVATHDFTSAGTDDCREMIVNPGGSRLVMLMSGVTDIVQLSLEDDDLTQIDRTTSVDFVGGDTSGTNQFRAPAIREAPHAKTGAMIFYNDSDFTLRGYRKFDQPETYTYELGVTGLSDRYAMAYTGSRPQ